MGTGTITISQDELKVMMKETFIEVLKERKDLLEEAVIEAIEDIGLARAIAEGAGSPSVSESEIFKTLDDQYTINEPSRYPTKTPQVR